MRGFPAPSLTAKIAAATLALGSVGLGVGHLLGQAVAFRNWTIALGILFCSAYIVGYVYATLRLRRRGRRADFWAQELLDFSIALIGVAATLVTLGLVVIEGSLWAYARIGQFAREMPTKGWMVIATIIVVAASAGTFFLIRLKLRFIYGMTEAAAGLAIAAHRVAVEPSDSIPTDGAFYIAILTAGIYLVVRGLDNMHQAIEAGDPVVRWANERANRIRRGEQLNAIFKANAAPPPDRSQGN